MKRSFVLHASRHYADVEKERKIYTGNSDQLQKEMKG